MHTQGSPRMSVHPLVYSLSFAEEVVQPQCVRGFIFKTDSIVNVSTVHR